MEIWSPRTTKRLLKIAGVVLVVGFTAGLVLEYWLNPVERRDVSAMLEQARNVRNSSKASFEQQREKGKEIETAASIALFFATNCKKMELAGPAGAASAKIAAMYQDLAESSCRDYE